MGKLSQKETEKLIAGIRDAYEMKIRQLENRIDALNVENRNLRATVSELKSRESRVGRAILDAECKGEEIRAFYRLNAETELKTLQLFAEKWKKLAEQMIGIFPDGEAERYVDFADSLAALLGKDPDYFLPREGDGPVPDLSEKSENTKPVQQDKEEKFDPKAVIGKYIESEEEEETGFNLDDVLNPKGQLDLEKLCRNLGLMGEEDAAEK